MMAAMIVLLISMTTAYAVVLWEAVVMAMRWRLFGARSPVGIGAVFPLPVRTALVATLGAR